MDFKIIVRWDPSPVHGRHSIRFERTWLDALNALEEALRAGAQAGIIRFRGRAVAALRFP